MQSVAIYFNLTVYTNGEKVDLHKYITMTEFVCVRTETQPNCTGVEETPAVCVGVVNMTSV